MIRAAFLALGTVAALGAATRPRLVVVLVAEQFRSDYLDRYRTALGPGGLQKLMKGGAVYPKCRYEYAATYPASGAAVLATGSYPDRNGIVAEQWYDRRSRRVVRAADDDEFAAVTVEGTPRRPAGSPRRLVGTTLADQMRMASGGRWRSLAVSLRDQTAVMLAGRHPAGCYWTDETGRFATSTYYASGLPKWVQDFQQEHAPLRVRGQAWRAVDAREGTPALRLVDGPRFEDFVATYLASPLAMEDEFAFAREAVAAEELGRGGGTDLLSVSLSSLYLVGLEGGAESPLVRDMILRMDRQIEEFVAWLEARFGPGNVWVVFTATQGLPESPATLEDAKIPIGRVSGDILAGAVNARLSSVFGRGHYVEKFVFPSLYLNRDAVGALRAEDVSRVAGQAALGVDGVADYWGADRMRHPALARSQFGGRSGDLLFAYHPYYWERYGEARGVATGSPYHYDTLVPLVLYGPAFRNGIFTETISPADVAVTLAEALEIMPPAAATGRVLSEALKDP